MSSQHEDYVAFHSTVNTQNRSNYEVKYQLIRQIPLGIVAISSFYNFFVKDNWNWFIGIFSLGAIISSLITYLLLYYLLEFAISTNEQWEKIASKNQDLPPNKQLKEEPTDKKKYDRLNKWMRRAYTTSIIFCVILTITMAITIGGTQMSATKTKSQTTEVVTAERKDELGIVTSPIVPAGGNPDIEKKGIVTSPIVPAGGNPDITVTPTPEQPIGDGGGGQDNPPSTPETQTPVSQPTDGSNKN
ncbi:MAG: hypothetical protein OXG97_02490 [Candidatus Poribacteria bacterium]|nr:hypothetical protein [Candidatus Poribacteria bacterium]